MRRQHAEGGKGEPWRQSPHLVELRLKIGDNLGEAEVWADQGRILGGKRTKELWRRIGVK